MCLAIPMRVVQIDGDKGVVEIGGMRREVGLQLIEDVKIGDYLIIHAGFAIQKLDEQEALETLKIWEEMAQAMT